MHKGSVGVRVEMEERLAILPACVPGMPVSDFLRSKRVELCSLCVPGVLYSVPITFVIGPVGCA